MEMSQYFKRRDQGDDWDTGGWRCEREPAVLHPARENGEAVLRERAGIECREWREGGLSAPRARGGAATGLRWQRSHTTHFLSLLTLWGSLGCHYRSAWPRHYEAAHPPPCVSAASASLVSRKAFIILFVYPVSKIIIIIII